MIMGMAEFVKARLDEVEHLARMAAEDASAGAHWHAEATYKHSGHAGVQGENGEIIVYDEGSPSDMEAAHIAYHDPARVLREVAAIRAIVESQASLYVPGHVPAAVTLRHLATIWSDHPDYQEALKP